MRHRRGAYSLSIVWRHQLENISLDKEFCTRKIKKKEERQMLIDKSLANRRQKNNKVDLSKEEVEHKNIEKEGKNRRSKIFRVFLYNVACGFS